MTTIIPAILTNSLHDFSEKVEQVKEFPKVSDVQIDFADNNFVHNLTLLPAQIPSLPLQLTFTAHLMVQKPALYFTDLEKSGFEGVAMHWESFPDEMAFQETFAYARTFGLKPQLAINPTTPLEKVKPFFKFIDSILIMGVNPGFYGSKYVPETEERVSFLRLNDFYGIIFVDGGVTRDKVRPLISAGADALVVGSAIWTSKNPKESFIELLKETGESST